MNAAVKQLKRSKPLLVRSRSIRRLRRIRRFAYTMFLLVLIDNVVFVPVAQAEWYNPIDWVTGGVGKVVAEVANAVFGGIIKFIAELIANAVTSATELLVTVFNNINVGVNAQGKMTDIGNSGIQHQFVALGASLVLLLFLVRICSGLATGQMSRVARELFFDLPFTIIGTVAAGAIGYLILTLTDEMSASITANFAKDIGAFAGKYFVADQLVTGGLFSFLFAILYILGAIALGAQLVVRAALLEVIFIVAPAMIATRTWEGSRRYSRRFIEIAIGLMFGKPAAALALAIGAANLSAANGVVGLLKGVTLVLLGSFMPFAVFKLIPIVEGAAVQQGISGAPIRAAQTALGTAASIAILKGAGGGAASAAKGGGGDAGGGGAAAGAAGPSSGGGANPSPSSGSSTGSKSGGSGSGSQAKPLSGNASSGASNSAAAGGSSPVSQANESHNSATGATTPVVAESGPATTSTSSSSSGSAAGSRSSSSAAPVTASRSANGAGSVSSPASGQPSAQSSGQRSSRPSGSPSAPVVVPSGASRSSGSTSSGGASSGSAKLRGANQALGSIRTVQADDLFSSRTDEDEEVS